MNKLVENLPLNFFYKAKTLSRKNLFFDKINGSWRGITYFQAKERIISLSNYLISLGIKKNDRILLCSQNRSEWAIANLAIMSIGAIVVPAYTTNTINDHKYILSHCQAKLIFVSGDQVGDNIIKALKNISNVKQIIFFENCDKFKKKYSKNFNFFDFKKIIQNKTSFSTIKKHLEALSPIDVCSIIYTSGTGGHPKGVMLTHKSIQSNIIAAIDLLNEVGVEKNAVFLSLLPLAHSYEHTAGMHLPVQIGAEVWYCESVEQVSSNLIEVQPTLMTAVPRLYEVLHDRISKSVKSKGSLSEFLFFKTIELGQKRLKKLKFTFFETIFDCFLEFFIRSKVKKRFGNRLNYFISGGAALNPEIGNFFMSLGIKILQGYGQTEASPLISANRPKNIKIDTVGPPVKGVSVKLTKDNELLVKGDCVMKGYWRDSKSTKKTIKKGWLYTGDLASFDKDNFITIIGRKKDIIVNSGGENISPSKLEAILCIEPEIEQAIIFGDKKPWISAVIVPSIETKNKSNLNIILSNKLRKINENLSSHEKIRKFIIAKENFSIKNGQMTPSLKVKRHKVIEKYGVSLNGLYSSKLKNKS